MTIDDLTPEELRRLYIDEQMTPTDIAAMFNVPKDTIASRLRRAGFRRNRSQAMRLVIQKGRAPRPVTVKLKRELLCRGCGATWQYNGNTITTTCPYCGKQKDARDRTGQVKISASLQVAKITPDKKYSKEERRRMGARSRAMLRRRVLFRICGSITPRCVRCGCDDERLLEINHIYGGGNRENQKGKFSSRFYYDIANGKRPTDDLELLCKPCNAIHALELKFGSLPMKVVWLGTQSTEQPGPASSEEPDDSD